MHTKKTLVSSINLEVPALTAYGNAALVAAAQQAALRLLKKESFQEWVKAIHPKWAEVFKDHPGNINPG